MSHHDTMPVKSLALGIGVGFGAIAAIIFIVFFIAQWGLEGTHGAKTTHSNLEPIGQVNIEGQETTASTTQTEKTTKTTASESPKVPEKSKPVTVATASLGTHFAGIDVSQGQQIYKKTCAMCHEMGIIGAPKFGDKESWTPRIVKGMQALFDNALEGFSGKTGVMPPRGGQPTLPDNDVKAAVAYMVSQVQPLEELEAQMKEDTPTAPEEPKTTAKATASQQTSTATGSTAELDMAKAEKTYTTACALCHQAGIANAPIFGDKAAWAPRIAKGMDALFTTALNGIGAMPPKGGQMHLPDEDIKAVVTYMVSKAK